MSNQKAITISRPLAAILVISTLIFASVMAFTLLSSPKVATQVPYVGMTITLLYNKTTDIGTAQIKDSSHIVIKYPSKTPEGLFRVYAHEELFTFDLLVNATTRQYVAGAEEGAYVGHMVPTKLSIGDIVPIYPRRNFTVLSTNEDFELQKGFHIKAFKLYFEQRLVNGEIDYSQTIIRYYDTTHGLLLEELDNDSTYNPSYGTIAHHFKTTLVDDPSVDNDGDGLSDFKELLITRTDPLSIDTDGDLWTDSNDPYPLNNLLPNTLILTSLIVLSASTFYISRRIAEQKSLNKMNKNRKTEDL